MTASGEFFRYPMEGCLSGCDGVIDQRPYHRNCKCELHKNNRRKHNCPNGASSGSIVSYPIRRSWSEGSLALSSMSSSPNYGASPSAAAAAANDCSAPLPPSIGGGKMLKKQVQIHRQGSMSEDDDDLFPRMKWGGSQSARGRRYFSGSGRSGGRGDPRHYRG